MLTVGPVSVYPATSLPTSWLSRSGRRRRLAILGRMGLKVLEQEDVEGIAAVSGTQWSTPSRISNR